MCQNFLLYFAVLTCCLMLNQGKTELSRVAQNNFVLLESYSYIEKSGSFQENPRAASCISSDFEKASLSN